MRELTGFWKKIAGLLVGLWAGFLIYTAVAGSMHPLIQGPISLSFGLALAFLVYPLSKNRLLLESPSLRAKILFGRKDSPSLLDILMAIASLVPVIYVLIHYEEIAAFIWARGGVLTIFLAIILVVMLLEVTRRSLGNVIPLVVLCFIGYAFFGYLVPGFFGHSGFGLREVASQLYMGQSGIWGLLTDLTSRMIALFVIFGSVLFATGAGKGLVDLARYGAGRIRGGAGQIGVVCCAAFGTLSGSPVANVATTGVFTIPTMKQLGYDKELAGATVAAASIGGQLMPPVMGAGAFVMAEILGIPYLWVAIAAIIPAIIFFLGVGGGLYTEAVKHNLGKLPAELIPKARQVFAPHQVMTVLIPIGVLLFLLIRYLAPATCAAWALITAMALFMLTGGRLSLEGLRERIKTLAGAYYTSVTKTLAWLMVMMSCVQIAVCLINFTGFGVKLAEVILRLAGVNMMLALMAAMVTAILLGMGMPATASYVIAAAVLAPALIGMGLDALPTHLFIFYFAILSGLTPPVCIVVFTAVAIAGGSWLRTAWLSMRLAIGAYVIPYIFLFSPTLLMKGEPVNIIIDGITAGLGVIFLGAGLLGCFIKPTTILERLMFIAGGFMLMYPGLVLVTDGIGLALVAGGWLSQRFLHRRRRLRGEVDK